MCVSRDKAEGVARCGKLVSWAATVLDRASMMLACPHVILMPEHYRPDGTCRCNDPEHNEMEEWGYEWDADEEAWV